MYTSEFMVQVYICQQMEELPLQSWRPAQNTPEEWLFPRMVRYG